MRDEPLDCLSDPHLLPFAIVIPQINNRALGSARDEALNRSAPIASVTRSRGRRAAGAAILLARPIAPWAAAFHLKLLFNK